MVSLPSFENFMASFYGLLLFTLSYESFHLYCSYLEPAVRSKRCPAISIRTVSHSETGDILVRVRSSLCSYLGNSHRPPEVNLDPLPSIVLLSWPSTFVAAPRFQVESGQVGGMVSIPFTWSSDVSFFEPSLGDPEGSCNGFPSC